MLLSDTLAITNSLCLLSRSSTYVMLILIGVDVIHSFAMPALGIKMDCIPARVLSMTMCSEIVGSYYGQCSELCGALHSFMPISCVFV